MMKKIFLTFCLLIGSAFGQEAQQLLKEIKNNLQFEQLKEENKKAELFSALKKEHLNFKKALHQDCINDKNTNESCQCLVNYLDYDDFYQKHLSRILVAIHLFKTFNPQEQISYEDKNPMDGLKFAAHLRDCSLYDTAKRFQMTSNNYPEYFNDSFSLIDEPMSKFSNPNADERDKLFKTIIKEKLPQFRKSAFQDCLTYQNHYEKPCQCAVEQLGFTGLLYFNMTLHELLENYYIDDPEYWQREMKKIRDYFSAKEIQNLKKCGFEYAFQKFESLF